LNKLVLVLLATLLSSMVQAQGYGRPGNQYGCSADMIDLRGGLIQNFDGYDCVDALKRCNDELYWAQNQGRYPRAYCQISQYRPTPAPQPYPRPTPRPQPRPEPAPEWREVDLVNFRDGKTAVAIANCKRAREADSRCNGRMPNYNCSACSEIAHSDSSTYRVFQLLSGGYQPAPTPRPTPRPWPAPAPTVERQYERTFHFTDRQTAVARQKCESYRASLPQCSSAGYECTPCTIESHTDHSQFDIYRLVQRY